MSDEFGEELVAVTGGAAVVGAEQRVALGGQQRTAVDPEAQAIERGRGRATMQLNHQRQRAVTLPVIRRQFENALNLGAVGRFPRHAGNLRQLPGVDLRVQVG